jgi:hypothetical protein
MYSFWLGALERLRGQHIADGVQLNPGPIPRHQPTAAAIVGMRRRGGRPKRGYGYAGTGARQELPSTRAGSAISHGVSMLLG